MTPTPRSGPARRRPTHPRRSGRRFATAAALEGKAIGVLMAYADRLERFTRWWVQLWAESLGKDGKGSQPVAAIGPVDQHSQLQLYLAGPNDKLFTVVTTGVAGQGPAMSPDLAERAGEPGFSGKTIGDLVAAQGRATADTLARNNRPTRRIHVETLDERAMGELSDALHAGDDPDRLRARGRSVRPAGGRGGQGAGQAVSGGRSVTPLPDWERGDTFENWITTSMLRNSAKANFTLEELSWTLHPEGSLEAWDGLTRWFLQWPESGYITGDPYIQRWRAAALSVPQLRALAA